MAKDPTPHVTDDNKCSNCKVETEMGFGLAGGGYGTYNYCPKCYFIFHKTQETQETQDN